MQVIHQPRVDQRRAVVRCTSRGLSAALLALAAVVCCAPPSAHAVQVFDTYTGRLAQPVMPLSKDALATVQWVMRSSNNDGAPFVVLDKKQAHVWAFDSKGWLVGDSPALLGAARGDHSVPGIGERAIADIRPEERTTPSGRFVARKGRNADGEDIFWVDYDAAISMHRVRATSPKEKRLERLATSTVADNRISYGCINLPAAFYERVVDPLFMRSTGVVYVLPEAQAVQTLWQSPAKSAALLPAPSAGHIAALKS